ncbi:BAG family molecular chaperone regulator 4-like isoform X2 [Rhododendron vialii]|uniref:BAG family molecular chaperone regulator 4-like isoform X2 n=1 Tax=Rhododendron vialii TaxID=182163 RepID=UPI0026602525|nr:BAG family molecular chaperone regulator 4-like isoform X2 [Rhododendron vialii]
MDGRGRNTDLLHGGRRRRGGPTIGVNVLDADADGRICLRVPAHTTFGELKMHIYEETRLVPDKQRLLFEEMERDDQEYLDTVGVNDNANVFLVEKKKKRTFEEGEGSRLSSAAEVRPEKEPGSVEVPVEDPLEKENRLKALTSCAAVAKVRAEDDKLSEQSGSVEVPVEDPLEKENRLKALTSCAAVAKVRAEDDKLSEQSGSVEVPVEDPLEKENRLKALTSCAAVAKVRAEDDKLSEQSGSVEVPVEDPLEKENRLKALTSRAAVAKVRAEDDKLSEQVAALKGVVNGGTQAGEKEISELTELLMKQLLKLDGIEAVGEGIEQRKLEVVRIHSILKTLDSLKGMNSNPLGNDSRNV